VPDEQPVDTTPVERLVARAREQDETHQLSDRARQSQRSLEGYLQAGNRPRWMERLGEIQQGTSAICRRLAREHERLAEEHRGDPEGFARAWTAYAERFDFADVNERIRQHNEWFPIERQLAIDPRTRDYVLINGRSYRRRLLTAQWILEQFPPRLAR
jgi:hypothetical protein